MYTLSPEVIDLCTADGHVKSLCYHLGENGSTFFQLRELCLVVKVYGASPTSPLPAHPHQELSLSSPESDTSHPYYIPALPEYADNAEFVGTYVILCTGPTIHVLHAVKS